MFFFCYNFNLIVNLINFILIYAVRICKNNCSHKKSEFTFKYDKTMSFKYIRLKQEFEMFVCVLAISSLYHRTI